MNATESPPNPSSAPPYTLFDVFSIYNAFNNSFFLQKFMSNAFLSDGINFLKSCKKILKVENTKRKAENPHNSQLIPLSSAIP